jgi:hypothetical protein
MIDTEEDHSLGVIVSECNCMHVLRAKPIIGIRKKKRKQRNGSSSLVLADNYAAV